LVQVDEDDQTSRAESDFSSSYNNSQKQFAKN